MGKTWQTSRWFVITCPIYLLLFSVTAWMMIAVAGPSLWYAPCALLLFLSVFLWGNPSRGASSSLPFLLAFVVLLISTRIWGWPDQRGTATLTACALLVALGLCVTVIRATGFVVFWSTLSFALIVLSFASDRLFTKKVQIRTVQMAYSLTGKTPWGDDTQRDARGNPPVLVFVRSGEGYCYDAVFYEPLAAKLATSHASEVEVQYNVFSDFGRERGYNIRSIDGIIFDDKYREVVHYESYGGTTLIPSDGGKYVPPTCPR